MDPRHRKLRILGPSFSTSMLLLLPLALLVVVILVVYPNELALQSLVSGSPAWQHSNASHVEVAARPVAPDFRLLMGVLTLPGMYERRSLLRTVYALQQPSLGAAARVDVRFFFCRLASEEQRVLVALEAMLHGDVVELDCPENMDKGKTYAYFSSVPALFGAAAYDFVMKADDDTFFRLPQLVASLRRAPREDLYYGCRVPCEFRRPSNEYMSGMGYVLSWDLVEWIVAAGDQIRNQTWGPEDRTVRRWFPLAGKAKNWVDAKPNMYDFPTTEKGFPCAHELVPDTIAVHRLKDNERWSATLKYFNFTAGLQPSNFFRNH